MRIEHASLLTDAMFDQINRAKMNYGLVTQPIFFFAEVASYQAFLTSSQYQEIYRVKSMERSKALVALSSDAPCTPWAEPDSVFYSLYAAVTRRAANGEVVGPEEAITVGTGLLAYTKDAALMGGFEKTAPWWRARTRTLSSWIRTCLPSILPRLRTPGSPKPGWLANGFINVRWGKVTNLAKVGLPLVSSP